LSATRWFGWVTELSHVRGIADLRIQQQSDYPKFHIEAARTKAAQGGFTESDIANSVLNADMCSNFSHGIDH
jgi:Cu/Ag efflux pump CusA